MNGPRALLKGGGAPESYNRGPSCQRASQSQGRAVCTFSAGPRRHGIVLGVGEGIGWKGDAEGSAQMRIRTRMWEQTPNDLS